MKVARVGDWSRAARTLRHAASRTEAAIEGALREEAEELRRDIARGLTSQEPGGRPLEQPSALTLASRKLEGLTGRRALLASLEMRNALMAVARGMRAFVGIPDGARGSDGRVLAKVAEVQEHGAGPFTIRVTPAMRAYLGALKQRSRAPRSRSDGDGVVLVTIPARPFLRPAFARYAHDSRRRFLARVSRRLGLGGS